MLPASLVLSAALRNQEVERQRQMCLLIPRVDSVSLPSLKSQIKLTGIVMNIVKHTTPKAH